MTTTPTTTTTDAKRKALGRGLDSLLPRAAASAAPAAAAPAEGEGVRELPLELIDRNPHQTRAHLDENALRELAASVQATGIVQPIVVRPIDGGRYQIIAGERRWRASELAGKTSVPAMVRRVSNEQAMEMTIIENLQREDLNPMEQAWAFERLARDFGLTQEQIAQRTGKDRATIANFLRLLRLPGEVQHMIQQGQLSFGHARTLLSVESADTLIKLAERVLRDALSVRQTEDLVFHLLHPVEKTPPARYVDPNVRAAERELEQALGVRVRIKDRKGKGKIVIEYASLEDFDRVVEALKK